MLGLSEIRQTKVYQEALTEGREEGREERQQEVIFQMARYGLSAEAIAEILSLPMETVTEILENCDRDDQ